MEALQGVERARVQYNLASVYLDQAANGQTVDLSQAVNSLTEAAQAFRQAGAQREEALSRYNLANAYLLLADDGDAALAAQATTTFTECLDALEAEGLALEAAHARLNLAASQLQKSELTAPELEQVVAQMELAAQELAVLGASDSHARCLANMAAARARLAELQPDLAEQHAALAIRDYEEALAALQAVDEPYLQALVQYNLALLHMSRGQLGPDAARSAVQTLSEALRHWPRDRWPEEWARCQALLGRAYYELKGDDPNNLQRAIRCFEEALDAGPKL